MFKTLTITSAILLLSACSSTAEKEIAATVSTLTPCEKVKALVTASNTQFDAVKGPRVNTKYGSIWQAKYHLVGTSCKINELSSGNVNYKCSETYDSQTQSNEIFENAVAQTKQCLGNSWQVTNQQKGENTYATFSNTTSATKVVLSTGKTLAKHRKTHFTSLEIGELFMATNQ